MYKSFISHLHSVFEGPGSVAGHCYEAGRFGIDVVWLTDHDDQMAVMKSVKRPAFTALDCKENADPYLTLEETVLGSHASWTFRHLIDEECYLLQASSQDGWGGGQVRLSGEKARTKRPLFSHPTVHLRIESSIQANDSDARFFLKIPINQTPPAHRPNYLYYYLGSPIEEPYSFPLAERKQGDHYVIDLADDAVKAGLTLDHNAGVYIFGLETSSREVTVKLHGFEVETAITDPADWQAGQAKLAQQEGERYGVTAICGYEFSAGESHMCYYGPPAPVFPYWDQPKPSMQQLTAYAASHGGITCCNHPLSAKNKHWDDEEKERQLEAKIRSLIESQAGGATLIEVGFPSGRRGYTLKQHLYLWDRLSLAGLRLYGVGVSDAHSNVPWETSRDGNNFANYVAAEDCRPETLTAGLRSGKLYMADPILYTGEFAFTTDQGKTMGDVQAAGHATLKLSRVPQGSTLTWVVDGETTRQEAVSGSVESHHPLSGSHFLRAELTQADGRAILLTNPIWMR